MNCPKCNYDKPIKQLNPECPFKWICGSCSGVFNWNALIVINLFVVQNMQSTYTINSIIQRWNRITSKIIVDQVKLRIGELIDQGLTDKTDIYSKIVEEFNMPRPTVRRIAREYRQQLVERIKILQTELTPDQKKAEEVESKRY